MPSKGNLALEQSWVMAEPLRQKAGALSGVSLICLWFDLFSGLRVIRIDSYDIVLTLYKKCTVEWFFIEMQEYRLGY